MGLIGTVLELNNPRLPDLASLEVEALADTGSVHLVITEQVRVRLKLEQQDTKEVTLADGSKREVPYVGPVEVRFKNRIGFTGAIVMGDQVLLGAIPMEDMDLVLLPKSRAVDVNPANPEMAGTIAK